MKVRVCCVCGVKGLSVRVCFAGIPRGAPPHRHAHAGRHAEASLFAGSQHVFQSAVSVGSAFTSQLCSFTREAQSWASSRYIAMTVAGRARLEAWVSLVCMPVHASHEWVLLAK